LAQYDQQLKEVSEKHQQEIISIEREHQEKVFIAIFNFVSSCGYFLPIHT
jgi:hypothetical protein